MKSSVPTVLFLQLPCLDNDVTGDRENVSLAAHYLRWSLEKRGLLASYDIVIPPPKVDLLDDAHTIDYIHGVNPDIICATLYLWNVERSISILRMFKTLRRGVRIAVGGPEVAADHPFLFTGGIADVAVTGEGEPVVATILASLSSGRRPVLPSTAWRSGRGYDWGPMRPVAADLAGVLPPPEHESNRPFADGVGYLETGRGCPLRCAFCCYNQRRRTASYLDADQVIERVSVLRSRGAREIRFIDPTFNSNPHFGAIVSALAVLNRDKALRFFAELRAETLTVREATLLAWANFTDIEVGVQSRNRAVLKAVGRPTVLPRLDRGIQFLSARHIRLTIDVMCGLPGQGIQDLSESVRWAAKIPGARVQFLHTLLLPGTDLRAKREVLELRCQDMPPYRVLATGVLSGDDMNKAEANACLVTGTSADSPTRRFVGSRLPDLFGERVVLPLRQPGSAVPGREARRAVIIRGRDLFSRRGLICRAISTAISAEPHVLWEFVLSPLSEEPLDLLDAMIDEIDRFPATYLDRWVVDGRRASRRIMILLRPGGRYGKAWIRAAEDLLAGAFH